MRYDLALTTAILSAFKAIFVVVPSTFPSTKKINDTYVRLNRVWLIIFLSIGAMFIPSVALANTLPTIGGTPAESINIGEQYIFQPEASDKDGDELRFIIRRKPAWLSFDSTTGELRGTPTLADVGLYENVLILVKDGTGQAKLPTFNIEVINPPPVISGVPATSVNAGEQYSFKPVASDANGDQLTYSISNKPSWASFNVNTGELKGTPSPTKTRNYRDVVISVSDGMSTVSLPPFYIGVIAGQFHNDCTATMQTGQSFSCQLPTSGIREFVLVDPPRGFSIQPKTGIIHWTPTTNQVGQHYLGVTARGGGDSTQWTVDINVADGAEDAAGIYVAPDGDDTAAGTATAPYKTIRKAADSAVKGDTIYLRGGVYYNEEYGTAFENRRYGSMARITTSGTGPKPITLRPYGNEYVKLVSDVTGLQFKNAQHWVVEHLELEGTAQTLSLSDTMGLWWADDSKKITGRGISTNSSQHITIRNNVIHDFAGAGVANNGSDMITVENNVIYNTSWWSTAGTHGVANSYLTTAPGNEGKEGLKMIGNLVFGNQSRVISHVFSKGFVTLAIDEGNGLHAQNNSRTYFGKARIENNLMLFNGKAGFGINTMDEVKVKNNSFYQNAQVVNTGELAVQSSTPTAITGNLFHPLSHRKTVKDSSKDYSRMNGNASTSGIDSAEMPESTLYSAVFRDPEALDFSPADSISADMGVPTTELQRMFAKVDEYGITVEAPDLESIDETYLTTMKQAIFDSWPEAYDHIKLKDSDTDYEYSYSQRCSYPNEPANCP